MKRPTGSTIFTVVIALVTLALLMQTLSLSPTSRMVPLWVVIPLFILLGLLLVAEITPKISSLVNVGLFGREHAEGKAATERNMVHEAFGGLKLAGWLLFLLATARFLGFPLAVGLFVALYTKIQARESTLLSLLLGAIMGAVVLGMLMLVSVG